MAKKSKGNISIANMLALIGLAGIGVVSFFGMLLHSSDGTPGGAIIGAVALLVGLCFLLVMSIKAKKAEDNPDKWRYVEWGCLVVYVVVAVCFATPFQRFFYILTEQQELQRMAREEVKAIQDMRQGYEQQQKKFLTDAVEQIKNYNDSKQMKYKYDSQLVEYVKGVGDNVDSWAAKASVIVKLQPDAELADIVEQINTWSIMGLSSLATALEKKDKSAWTDVENKISQYAEKNKLIPVITGGSTQPYRLDGFAQFDLGTPPEARFAQELRTASGNTVLGWVVYVVLHLLVLLNYVATSRSRFVGPRSGRKGGGMDL